MEAANHGPERIAALERLPRETNRPEEQADLELVLARIFNQQAGLVAHEKAIAWYGRALARNLLAAVESPAVDLARQLS